MSRARSTIQTLVVAMGIEASTTSDGIAVANRWTDLREARPFSDQRRETRFSGLDSLLSALSNQHQFNGVILIAEKGRVVFQQGYGVATSETSQRIDGNTMFELASVTKQFTALGVVMLKERGKLSYDDRVTQFFPTLTGLEGVTIRHLLSHTSGVPDYLRKQDLFDSSRINTNADLIAAFSKAGVAVDFPPGSKYNYTNTGYALLASIIEQVSGQTFGQFLDTNVFRPLKMSRSFVYQRRLSPRTVSNYATGYRVDRTYTVRSLPDTFAPTRFIVTLDGIVGDGNVSSTASDLLRWDRALYTTQLVSAEGLRELFTPATLQDGTATSYGLGWNVEQHKEYGTIVSHSGSVPGYRTYIERHLGADKTLIILQNQDGVVLPKLNARQAMYGQPLTKVLRTQVAIPPSVLQQYVGEYQDVETPTSIVSLTKGREWLVYNSTENKGWDLPLFPESSTAFFAKALDIQVEFVTSVEGTRLLRLKQGGKVVGEAKQVR
jgi:CubicO group peptidase (beta-lactamase class C family)